jgi:hypothetical protein
MSCRSSMWKTNSHQCFIKPVPGLSLELAKAAESAPSLILQWPPCRTVFVPRSFGRHVQPICRASDYRYGFAGTKLAPAVWTTRHPGVTVRSRWSGGDALTLRGEENRAVDGKGGRRWRSVVVLVAAAESWRRRRQQLSTMSDSTLVGQLI